jgi:hypothetical protein
MNNLALPICPKCNNTKHVKEVRCIKLIDGLAHECIKCNINWSQSYCKSYFRIETGTYGYYEYQPSK